MLLGHYIQKIRLKKGYAVYKLHRLSGISTTYINQIEAGKRKKPSIDVLKKLAQALEVPYERLMRYAGYLEKSKANLDSSIPVYTKKQLIQNISTESLEPDSTFNLNTLLSNNSFIIKGSQVSSKKIDLSSEDLIVIQPNYTQLEPHQLVAAVKDNLITLEYYTPPKPTEQLSMFALNQEPNSTDHTIIGIITGIIKQTYA